MADNRDRDCHRRNQGSPPAAQEQEDHHHHQHQGLDHGRENCLNGFFDEDRSIHGDPRLHPRRQSGLQPRQDRLHPARNLQRICRRLLYDAQPDRLVAADADDLAVLIRPRRGVPDVFQTNGVTFRRRDDHVVEIFRRSQIGARLHRELALRAFDAPAGRLHILVEERVLDVMDGQSLRGQAFAINPYPHRILALAADDHR